MSNSVNFIEQFKGMMMEFYEKDCTHTELAVYMSLFYIWNRCGWKDEISIARDEIMTMSRINSKETYHKAMRGLDKKGMIKYNPSKNPYKGSTVNMFENRTSSGTSTRTSSGTSSGTSTGSLSKPVNPLNLVNTRMVVFKKKENADYVRKNLDKIEKRVDEHRLEKEPPPESKSNSITYLTEEEMGELKEVWIDYLEHRKEIKAKKYKSKRSERAGIKQLAQRSGNDPRTAQKIVEQTRANNWQGLFALKNDKGQQQQDNNSGVMPGKVGDKRFS